MSTISRKLLSAIKRQYRLEWFGTHGVMHWNRVYNNGMRLSTQEGVNPKVVQLFAIFHDSCRKNEHKDNNHGRRGAELAGKLRKYYSLNDEEFSLLTTACSLHTSTLNYDNITVQVCFDADRLDLYRVRIMPDPDYLCTPMAKSEKMINWANKRSLNNKTPEKLFGGISLGVNIN